MLALHNDYRVLHNTDDLILDDSVSDKIYYLFIL